MPGRDAASPAPGWSLPRLSPAVLARVLVAFAATLAVWFLLRAAYTRGLLAAGAPVLEAMGGPPAERVFVEKDSRFFLRVEGLPDAPEQPRLVEIRAHAVHWNLVLLATLLLATRARLLRRRPFWLASAAAALFASHVLHLVLDTLVALGKTFAERGVAFLGEGTQVAVGASILVLDTVVSPVLPFALWAPFVLAPGAAPRALEPPPGIGRNDPCPCGSGKKHKRCCGAGR